MNVIKIIDDLNRFLCKFSIASSAIIVFVQFIVVLLRYIFGISYIWLQESIMYIFTVILFLSVAFIHYENSHVRIDILFGKLSQKAKLWVDMIGGVFMLLPTSMFLIYFSWGYVVKSWMIMERSHEPAGLPLVYLLKTLIIVFSVQLFLQAISNLYKNYMAYKKIS